jgi:hypothetical protein
MGLEIAVNTSEEITSLSSLGIVHLGQQCGEFDPYTIAMFHPAIVLYQAGDISVGDEGDHQKREPGQAETGDQPSADGPISEHPY